MDGVINKTRKRSPEVWERAVRLIAEHAGEYGSERAAISSISEKIGCTADDGERFASYAGGVQRLGDLAPGTAAGSGSGPGP